MFAPAVPLLFLSFIALTRQNAPKILKKFPPACWRAHFALFPIRKPFQPRGFLSDGGTQALLYPINASNI